MLDDLNEITQVITGERISKWSLYPEKTLILPSYLILHSAAQNLCSQLDSLQQHFHCHPASSQGSVSSRYWFAF